MNKKEHQIWQDFKYDEYLMNKHIFSYEKQLRFQGKIVLDYIICDGFEAQETFQKLDNENKTVKQEQVLSYQNESHELWKNKNFYRDFLDFSMLYDEYIVPVKEEDIKFWN
jgi:hypothetical protein